MDQRTLARAQGSFNIVTGLWPWVSMRTFELVLGPKVDHWLVRAVANLVIAVGVVQVVTPDDAGAERQTRRAGIGVAAALLTIDLVYVARRRISRMYLLDAAGHLGWILAWLRAGSRGRS